MTKLHHSEMECQIMAKMDQLGSVNITLPTIETGKLFAVYEIKIWPTQGEPPVLIYIGAETLLKTLSIRQPRANSDFAQIFAVDRPLMLRIISIHDDAMEAREAAVLHVKAQPFVPRCNSLGFALNGQTRRIHCSNGKTYGSQKEAAESLGINQGAISQHMNGRLKAVRGYTFTFVK
jgi:hypothetical protein